MPPPIANELDTPLANVNPADGTVVKNAVVVGVAPELKPGDPPPPPQAARKATIRNVDR